MEGKDFHLALSQGEKWRKNNFIKQINCFFPHLRAKEYKKKIDKEYRDKNHDILKQKSNEYRNANREKIRQQQRNAYQDRKHIVKAYHSTIVNCPCGCSVTRSSIAQHRKTKKHLKLMKDKEQINT